MPMDGDVVLSVVLFAVFFFGLFFCYFQSQTRIKRYEMARNGADPDLWYTCSHQQCVAAPTIGHNYALTFGRQNIHTISGNEIPHEWPQTRVHIPDFYLDIVKRPPPSYSSVVIDQNPPTYEEAVLPRNAKDVVTGASKDIQEKPKKLSVPVHTTNVSTASSSSTDLSYTSSEIQIPKHHSVA